jgi:hypothetical protein
MLTKKDLADIGALIGSSGSRVITTLRAEMKQNTQELIDLITAGFNISADHEIRIANLERKSLQTN